MQNVAQQVVSNFSPPSLIVLLLLLSFRLLRMVVVVGTSLLGMAVIVVIIPSGLAEFFHLGDDVLGRIEDAHGGLVADEAAPGLPVVGQGTLLAEIVSALGHHRVLDQAGMEESTIG